MSGHVSFDEEVIKEHDKLRGTRQKIDEPDTPYNRLSFDGEEMEDLKFETGDAVEVLYNEETQPHTTPKTLPRNRMSSYEENSNAGLDWASLESRLKGMETEDEPPRVAVAVKETEFEEKRKHHYNEFEMMRKWKEQHDNEEEEAE